MILVASLALATGLQVSPACSWERPGVRRYTGDLVSSVDHYTDIPAATRAKLKQRLANPAAYDDHVLITRDAIEGSGPYDAEIKGMHFGDNQVCGSVTRQSWAATDTQRGLVYCEDGHCLLVPSVCGNLALVARQGPAGPSRPPIAAAPPAGATPGAGPPLSPAESFELPTAPTGAGMTTGAAGTELAPGALAAGGVPAVPAVPSFESPMPLVPPPSVTVAGLNPGLGVPTALPPPVVVPPVAAVPEPSVGALLLAGVAALAWRRRGRP